MAEQSGARGPLLAAVGHACRPLGVVPLLFVATTTLGIAIAVQAGLLGIPLFALLAVGTATYLFVAVEETAHGRPLPVLSIRMLNPVGDGRPLGALLVVAAVVGALGLVRAAFGTGPATVGTFVALGLAPAAVAVLAVEGDPWRALNPGACVRVARALGYAYVGIVGTAWAYAAVAAAIAARVPFAAGVAVTLVLALSYATLLGGLLHERRRELGFEPVRSPERAAERAARERDAAFDRFVDEAYAQVRAGRPEVAWASFDGWLASRGRSPEDLATLLARADRWSDARIAARLRRDLVSRLLALGRGGDAVLAVERAWRARLAYAPATARELARLAHLAGEIGHRATAARLLDECGPAFAADPEIAALLARRGTRAAPHS